MSDIQEQRSNANVVEQTNGIVEDQIKEKQPEIVPKTEVTVDPSKKERTFTQAEFDEIVKSKKEQARRSGYEEAKREFLSKLDADNKSQQPQQQYSRDFELGYNAALVERQKQFDKIAADEFVSRLQVKDGTSEADEVSDFFKDFSQATLPLIHQLNAIGNSKDTKNTFEYLKSNPKARQEIKSLIHIDMVAAKNGLPSNVAHSKLLEIAERIKQNNNAENVKSNNPRPPMNNDIKPSTISIGGKSQLKVSDIIKNHR